MADDLQTLPAGHRLGAYEVRRVLGTGTFGNVYLCVGEGAGETVAVREYVPRGVVVRGDGLRVQLRSPDADAAFAAGLAGFVERAERMMAVDHPNVVHIHGVFQANGTACVAMDYVPGRPLSSLLEAGETLPADELLETLQPVADGLLAMHRAGIRHGNLGLESLIVGDNGTPVLLGLAVPAQDEFGFVGNPGYAPIEHYSAHAGLVGVPADVYSLGAIVYRCVTGMTPPEAPIRAERDTLVPTARAVRGQANGRRKYPADLLAAVDAALTLDPEGRPEGVETLRDALGVSGGDARAGAAQAAADPEAAEERTDDKARIAARGSMAGRAAPVRSGRSRIVIAATTTVVIAISIGVYLLRPEGELQPAGEAIPEQPPPAQIEPPALPEPPAVPQQPEPSAGLADVDTPATDSSPPESEEPPPEPTAALVVVTSPPGVVVLLDGSAVGETPLELPGLATGEHRIALSHPHYHTVASDLTLSGDSPTRIERELVRATGTLRVTTTPSGAWIESNGVRLADATPATLSELPAGPVALKLGASGYVSVDVGAVVPKDEVRALEVTLERALGTLTLALSPPDAEVLLPDLEFPYEPGVNLPEGTHRIRVTKPGYRSVTDTVEVAGATRDEIVLEPDRHYSLTVATDPPGAVVTFVDAEHAYSPGMLMPPGEYRLRVSLESYAPWEGTVRHGVAATVHDVSLEFVPAEYADPLSSGGTGPVMTVIPAGSFRMGCVSGAACTPPELPVHPVTIETPFAMSKYEVTFEDFDRFVQATGWPRPDDLGWGRERRPVINVSWEDAAAYANWLSSETGRRYALPSEAEWEYAARAGADTAYAWGDSIDEQANCDDCSPHTVRHAVRGTEPVGSFRPNAWGLYDMHGNVWEWVLDCWNETYAGAPTDGNAWTEGDCRRRLLRGGSWFNAAALARSAARLGGPRTVRGNIAGFRVVARND